MYHYCHLFLTSLFCLFSIVGSKPCADNEFQCVTGSPHCIMKQYMCNGLFNCFDGSDEDNCNTTCPDWKFTCNDGGCVYKSWVCDGDKDCDDGSDEFNCSSKFKRLYSNVQMSCKRNFSFTEERERKLMKFYTFALYYLRMCMKEDYPSPNYFKGDN